MGKKGGDTRVKRQMAPTFWDIRRKQSQFVVRVKPGPHPKNRSYPLGMILRDALRVASTMHEAKRIINDGKIKVDGSTRKDVNFAVGLMDVIELVPANQSFRMVPKDSELLMPVAIDANEKSVKLAKVTSKVTIKGKKIQYGFHDGKTLISDQDLTVGDTCVIQLPKINIINHIKFEVGTLALITTGENAGNIGKIEDIRDGVFSLPKRAIVSFAERSVELPVEMVMAVGKDHPLIKVN